SSRGFSSMALARGTRPPEPGWAGTSSLIAFPSCKLPQGTMCPRTREANSGRRAPVACFTAGIRACDAFRFVRYALVFYVMRYTPHVPRRILSSYSMLEGAIDPKAIAKLAKE